MESILKKIAKEKITIGIVGLGYVGLDLVRLFNSKDNCLIYGFDSDKTRVKSLNKKQSYINYISNKEIASLLKKSKFSTSFENISKCDVILLCLPTPLTLHKTPDLSFVSNAISKIKFFLKKNQTIILESTTYPGTTEEYLIEELKNNFKIGKDIFVGYSPERIDPGNKLDYKEVPKIVSGYTKNCLKVIDKFYSIFFKTVPVKNLKTAEITKLYENIYRSVNIGLVNEMKIITEKLNINIFDVIEAAKTKPYGFSAFYPGPGLGGHCVPIDPYYLSWKVRSKNINTRFIELAAEINSKMPQWIIDKINEIFIKKKLSIHNSKLLIAGLGYKKNINDIRESPAIEIIKLLQGFNIKIDVLDTYCKPNEIKSQINYNKFFLRQEAVNFNSYDAIVIVTDHDNLNYDKILKHSKLIIDTRGRFKNKKSKKIYSI